MGNLTDISLLAEITWDGHNNSFQELAFPLPIQQGNFASEYPRQRFGPFVSKNYLSFLQSFDATGRVKGRLSMAK